MLHGLTTVVINIGLKYPIYNQQRYHARSIRAVGINRNNY